MNSLASPDDERRLIQKAKHGDPDAFGALYERHSDRIYRFVYSRVRVRTAAEDVTSEVFMKALRAIGRYQDTGRPFTAWLYQIATNAVADSFRAARPADDISEQRDLADPAPLPDEVAGMRDEMGRIWGAVEELPEQQRMALILKFQEDMKVEDIAVAMRKSPGAVKLLIHRGMARLRETFPGDGGAERGRL